LHEVVPGIWHWTAFHEPIGTRVSSYYVQPAGIVIDPKIPPGGLQALPEKPQQVVLTTGLHDRHAKEFADEFGIPIRASREAVDRLGDTLEVELYEHGDEIAPGVTSIHIGELCDDEEALHIAVERGAIAFADGLHRYGGQLEFFSDELLGEDPDRVKTGLRNKFSDLLARDFEHLLFAHGDPLLGGGKSALAEFISK
jgi:hypothetical protein